MADKPNTHIVINVYRDTYQLIQTIKDRLSAEKGVPISGPIAVREIVDFYIKAHQKGKK